MINNCVKIWVALILLLVAGTASAQYLYRYVDANGQTVLNNTVPPERAGEGYEVLDARTGKVIRTVEADEEDGEGGKTDGERIVFLSPEDKILLASYSSVEEIAAHLERKTVGLRAEIANIETDQRILRQELEEKREELQTLQEREREIPQELTDHIAELEGSDAGLAAALKRREQDLESTEQEYQRKMQRFEVLQNSQHRQ